MSDRAEAAPELVVPQVFPGSDGQPLGYATRGAGPRILCVPGGPGRAASYLDDLGGLDASYELVLADPRGSGASRPAEPQTLTVERLAADLEDLRAHLGEDHPVLLGHSFGCRVIAAYVEAHPGVARALVLLTPPPMGETDLVASGRTEILAARADDPDLAEAVDAACAVPDARPRDRTMLEMMSVPLWYGRWDDAARAHAARGADETPARTALTLRQSALGTPPPDLAALDLPILLLAGELDYLSPPGAIHAVHDRLQHSTYAQIEGAGHYPWLDEPELVRGVVEDFLATLDGDSIDAPNASA